MKEIKELEKKRVGILEYQCHHVFLYSLAKVARSCCEEVTVFTTKKLYQQIYPHLKDSIYRYNWLIKGEKESFLHFIMRVRKICNSQIDILFVNTIDGRLRDYLVMVFFSSKCPKILVTGRVTNWFGDKYSNKNLKDKIKLFSRRCILPKYDAVVVHTKSYRRYILDSHLYNPNRVFVLPFSIFKGESRINVKDRIKFVVVGSITQHRRDYEGLLEAFKKLWVKYKDKIELVLLGWPNGEYGRKIINKCKFLKMKGHSLKYFTGVVPEEKFIKEILKCDVLINPIMISNYPFGGFTAGLVEAIRYGKPGLYPKGYNLMRELKSSSLVYDDIGSLSRIMEKNIILNRERFLELKENAIQNAKLFSIDSVSKEFQKILSNF